jgi:hypothetical protein
VREFKEFGREGIRRYSNQSLSVVMDGGIEPEKVLDQRVKVEKQRTYKTNQYHELNFD